MKKAQTIERMGLMAGHLRLTEGSPVSNGTNIIFVDGRPAILADTWLLAAGSPGCA
jgi:DNA-binding GntR family transcriptional regulator